MVQIKASLVGTKPLIWRRIAVPLGYSFFELHVALQDAFEWEDAHLHQFLLEDPYKRSSKNATRISFPMPAEDMFGSEMVEQDERNTLIAEYLAKPKDVVYYEYDFGDSWIHKVVLEKIFTQSSKAVPMLIDGAEPTPEEDCGGLGGYYHLLDVLANPDDPEHEDMCDWLGLDDPKAYLTRTFNPNIRFRDPKKVLRAYERGFGL